MYYSTQSKNFVAKLLQDAADRNGFDLKQLPPKARLTAGPLSIDGESCRAYKDGQEIELTGREFLLLSYSDCPAQ